LFWVRCLLERCGLSAGIAESQYWCGFPGRSFLWGRLLGAALGFPAAAAVLPGGVVGGVAKRCGFDRFLSVAGLRFAA
jgi:hypothetical protein